MAGSGRLTSGQQAQLILFCSDHPVGFCETCQCDLALADLFASFLSHCPHRCPRCGSDVASSLHGHISMCRFIAQGVADTARDKEDAAPKPLNDTETVARSEYMLVTQLMTSRGSPGGHLRRLTTRLVVCGASAVAATIAMLAWITPTEEYSRPGTDGRSPHSVASVQTPAMMIVPSNSAEQPTTEKQAYVTTALHQRPAQRL
jgi:hypothetical protein